MRDLHLKASVSLLTVILGVAGVSPCFASDYKNPQAQASLWEPAVDFSLKTGNQRTLGSINIMSPIVQDDKQLIFGDLRTVISDQDTLEGNIGVGYRRIMDNDVILGGYAFFDARRTEHNNSFYQGTVGLEAIGEKWDGRVNLYTPIGNERKLAYTGATTASVVGTQLFVQDGRVFETAMSGYDVELGHALPGLDNVPYLDDVYAYMARYKFHGDNVGDVDGFRARTRADFGDWLRLGVEYQFSDEVRGDSVFAEVRVRMPFSGWSEASKKRTKLTPIQRRMMEPIQRDVDIVTQAEPLVAPVAALAADGTQSNVYFVDNTAAAGGDGSEANPFDTLAAAQAAAGAYDTVYVLRGDGMITNMDAGFTLDDVGQRLLGSGIALTVDTSSILLPDSALNIDLSSLSGYAIKSASVAPVITNTGGDGVTVTADNAEVAGITVDNAAGNGVFVTNADDARLHSLTATGNATHGVYVDVDATTINMVSIADVTASTNGSRGILVETDNAGVIETVNVSNSTTNTNVLRGVNVQSVNAGSRIGTVNVSGVMANNNTDSGISVGASTGGLVENAVIDSISATSNTSRGIHVFSTGSSGASNVNNVTVSNSSITLSGTYGISIDGDASDNIGQVNLLNTSTTFSARSGIQVVTEAQISDVFITDVTASNNTQAGIVIQPTNSGQITGDVTIRGSVTDSNTTDGILVQPVSGSSIDDIIIENSQASNNTQRGLHILADAATNTTLDDITVSNLVTDNNGSRGARVFVGVDDNVGDVTFNDLVTRMNGGDGLEVGTSDGSSIGAVNVSNITATSNNNGLYINTNGNSTMNFTMSGGTVSSNDVFGAYIRSDDTSNITTTVSDVVADSNMDDTIRFETQNNATMTATARRNTVSNAAGGGNASGFLAYALNTSNLDVTYENNVSFDNQDQGFWVLAVNSGNVDARYSGNSSYNNGAYGINIQNSGTGVMNVDLGGGALGSTAQNRVFNNTTNALRVDLNGGHLLAQQNWWGAASGLNVGSDVFLADGTIDASNHLTVDPNP